MASMLDQSIIDGLDPNVRAALLERTKDHDQFLRGSNDPVSDHPDYQNDFFKGTQEDAFIPPTSKNMNTGEREGMPEASYADLFPPKAEDDINVMSKYGDDMASENSLALSDKNPEDTMESRRNYVVEIIEFAEELNNYNTLPDEITMMAMPFQRLVTMWHLYEERVSRANILRMVRNAFAIACIAAGKGLDFFLKKILNNSFMDFSLWEKSFFAYVTTERKHHKPPFDRAFQKIINRHSSIKSLMSGEGSLLVLTGMHMYREYKRQEQVKKDADDEARRMRKEAMDEMKSELREQIAKEMTEQRLNWKMPPPSPESLAHSAPEFDTESLMSQVDNTRIEEEDEEEEEEEEQEASFASGQASETMSQFSENEEKAEEADAVTADEVIPKVIVPDPLDIEVKVDLDQYDDVTSQATSRTQQSRRKRTKKTIVPDLVL